MGRLAAGQATETPITARRPRLWRAAPALAPARGAPSCGAPSWRAFAWIRRLFCRTQAYAPARQVLITSEGPRAAAELALGDRVLTYDPEHAVVVERRVEAIDVIGPERVWELNILRDAGSGDPGARRAGRPICLSARQTLLTAGGWRRVAELRPGDLLETADSDGADLRAAVGYLRRTARVEPIYRVAVEGAHPLITDCLVAEAAGPGR